MSNRRDLAWGTLSLAVILTVVLEAAYVARPFAHILRKDGSSFVEMSDDGKTQIVVADYRNEGGRLVADRRIYDESGTFLASEEKVIEHGKPHEWRRAASPFWYTHWQHPYTQLGHVLDADSKRGDWADDLLRRLQETQGVVGPGQRVVADSPGHSATVTLVHGGRFAWSFDDGRFVCRDTKDGDSVVAGFGPDGWRAGPDGARGERFVRERIEPALAIPKYGGGALQAPFVLVDADRRAVHFVSLDFTPPDKNQVVRFVADPAKEPLQLTVKTVAVSGPDGEAPAPVPSVARQEWPQFNEFVWRNGARGVVGVPVRAGSEIVGVSENGIVRRAAVDAEEAEFRTNGSERVLVSALPPVNGTSPRMRMRVWKDDGTWLFAEISVPPITATSKCGLALDGFATMLRPPVLNAASFAGPAVRDWDDAFTRWTSDPLVAGGWGGGWFAASLAVAALCAWLAWRHASVRRPERALAWTIAAAALGPAGYVWMRVMVPKSHAERCACGRMRGVGVSKCAACAAAWPSPVATGIEVFA